MKITLIMTASVLGQLERDVAEEDALNLGGLEQRRRRPGQDGAARLEDVAPVRELERELHVLLDEEDTDALLLPNAPYQAAHLLHHDGGQTEKRLVDPEQARAGHE